MTFKRITSRTDGPLIDVCLFNGDHRPHWVRTGMGRAVVDLSGHTEAKWLSIDTIEHREDGKASKRTMVTLEQAAVKELRDFCNHILGEV